VLDTTLYDEICQWLATGKWFSPGAAVSSTIKSGHHNTTEILLKVALNTINLHKYHWLFLDSWLGISSYNKSGSHNIAEKMADSNDKYQ
jgi:hypothetical protein